MVSKIRGDFVWGGDYVLQSYTMHCCFRHLDSIFLTCRHPGNKSRREAFVQSVAALTELWQTRDSTSLYFCIFIYDIIRSWVAEVMLCLPNMTNCKYTGILICTCLEGAPVSEDSFSTLSLHQLYVCVRARVCVRVWMCVFVCCQLTLSLLTSSVLCMLLYLAEWNNNLSEVGMYR